FIEHFHRQIYGGIFEPGSPLADKRGFRMDAIEALRELNIPVVRWPGGCFASAYHWKNGVGQTRTPSYDKAWKVEEPNTFGTDEFVQWCREIGAEPYICTNAGSGTPEEMSDWVEYCNLVEEGRYSRLRAANGNKEPHKVRYWSIGNENYGDWEVGAKTVEEWGYFVRESAKMMQFTDPGIKLFAAATADRNWTLPLLERAGRYLDYISIHGYWDPLWHVNNVSPYMTCILRSDQPEKQILDTVDIIREAGLEGRVRIAFDEWNLRAWHHPGQVPPDKSLNYKRAENDRNEVYTMADACFSASFLNTCIRNSEHVAMANMAPIVNVRGPLFVHPRGVVRRTTFHVLKMFNDLTESRYVPAVIDSARLEHEGKSIAALDASVTRDEKGGAVAVVLVNRRPERPVACRLMLAGLPRVTRTTMVTLSGDSPDAYNDVDTPDRVVPRSQQLTGLDQPVVLPPHSVTIVTLKS
ncbi:MAG: alpha-L-arabinofuranosidase C-terminal domain-containing protein, partial [Woeseiaceae bacterium]